MAVLTENVQWLSQYLMQYVTAATPSSDLAIGFDLDDDHAGLTGAETVAGNATWAYGLPVTNFPHLKPSAASLELAMATGGAFMDTAQIVTTSNSVPGTTLETPVDENVLRLILGSIFQNGLTTTSAAATNFDVYAAYTTPVVPNYFVLARPMSDSTDKGDNAGDKSHVLNGCVVNSAQFTISEGGVWTVSAEVMAAGWTADATKMTGDGVATWGDVIIPAGTGLGYYKTENTNISFADTLDGNFNSFNTPEISFTLSNGLIPQFYNSATIIQFLLGDFVGEGTYRIPWGAGATDGHSTPLTRFAAGTVSQIGLYDGTGIANEGDTVVNTDAIGAYQFVLTAKPTDTDFGGDAEQGSDVSFKLVNSTATYPAFSGSVGYDPADDSVW